MLGCSQAYSGFGCQGAASLVVGGLCRCLSPNLSTTVTLPLIICQEGSSRVKMSLAYGTGQRLADPLMGGGWWGLVGLLGAGGAATDG